MACVATAVAAEPTAPVAHDSRNALPAVTAQVPLLFARYLSGGRSDVEIHLSTTGDHASARTRPLGDGLHHCLITGLASNATGGDAEDTRLLFASRLIHEATHCQTSPYASGLRSDNAGPAADLLVALTLESIADARAVFELHRVDGAAAAHRAVALVLPLRRAAHGVAHSTERALLDALEQVQARPESLATPEQVFAAALALGQSAAQQALPGLLRSRRGLGERGVPDEMSTDPDALNARAAQIVHAMARAGRAFEAGRFDNRAATVHASGESVSAGDHHFFIEPDGSIVRWLVAGAEGAHRRPGPGGAVAVATSVQDRLAASWLGCQSALDAPAPARVTTAIGHLLRQFGDGTPQRSAEMAERIDRSIATCRRAQPLSEWLEQLVDLLKPGTAAD